MQADWVDLGQIEQFPEGQVTEARVGSGKVAVTRLRGAFGVIHGSCNHAGGPLSHGCLEGDYVKCPWHNWKFHHTTGKGEPGYEQDAVPSFECKTENGRLLVRKEAATKRSRLPHPKHSLDREILREPGPLRVVGISTTNMDRNNPRSSTSEFLLDISLEQAQSDGAETRLIRLDELKFRNCEGYYSKSASACTWPCSITQMDKSDGMEKVYEALVHWADVVLLATPIRWGVASSLYFKMAERLNCVQNQITIADNVLIRNKVAGFIITGGQDNVQGVAGQLLCFFSELGFQFPQFPYIAHSRGWSAEDMENNVAYVEKSASLQAGARALAGRCMSHAGILLRHAETVEKTERGGRKANKLLAPPGVG